MRKHFSIHFVISFITPILPWVAPVAYLLHLLIGPAVSSYSYLLEKENGEYREFNAVSIKKMILGIHGAFNLVLLLYLTLLTLALLFGSGVLFFNSDYSISMWLQDMVFTFTPMYIVMLGLYIVFINVLITLSTFVGVGIAELIVKKK